MTFEDTKSLDKAVAKLKELGESLPENGLTTADSDALDALVGVLKQTSRYHSSAIPDQAVQLVAGKLLAWPIESLFPALDVLRMMMAHPDGTAKLAARRGGLSARSMHIDIGGLIGVLFTYPWGKGRHERERATFPGRLPSPSGCVAHTVPTAQACPFSRLC